MRRKENAIQEANAVDRMFPWWFCCYWGAMVSFLVLKSTFGRKSMKYYLMGMLSVYK